jgi:hypothetical protein
MKRIYDDSTVTSVRLERRDILLAKSLGISLSDALSSGIRNYAEVYIEMHNNPKPEWKHLLLDLKERELTKQKEKLKLDSASQGIIEDYLKVYVDEKQEQESKNTPEEHIRVWDIGYSDYRVIPKSQFNPIVHKLASGRIANGN